MANPFEQLRVNPHDARKSQSWYQAKVAQLKNVPGSVNTMLRGQKSNLTTRIIPGKLYLFQYDALHKKTLPYWDALPLVFPFRKLPDGFLALNLHYLPYTMRFKLMGALMDLTANTKGADHSMVASYNMLSSSSKYIGMQPCVKHYLTSHIRSRFLNIPHDQWLTAAMLPLEQFHGANKDAVWRQSRKAI